MRPSFLIGSALLGIVIWFIVILSFVEVLPTWLGKGFLALYGAMFAWLAWEGWRASRWHG